MAKTSNNNYEFIEDIDYEEVFSKAPKKVGEPVMKVLKNIPDMGTLLANIWVNQENLRPHFLGGVLFLNTCGYSVRQMRDVTRMLYKEGRGINFTWSRNRWQEEHSLAQRRATTQRLTEANVEYKNVTLENLLSEFGRKCLIRSSKELGIHGEEMRHCIASYHDSIINHRGMVLRIEYGSELYTAWVIISLKDGDQVAAVTTLYQMFRLTFYSSNQYLRQMHSS